MKSARREQTSPDGDWRIWLILAGRGWGKTRTACEDAGWFAAKTPDARIAFVAATSKDLRETIMEGQSGLLKAIPENCIVSYNRSFSEIKLWNGAQINGYSAEEPERLRGPNFSRAYCDELASWTQPQSFDMLMFALRIGKNPRCVITTTPKPTKIIKELVARARSKDGVYMTSGATYENAENLGAGFLEYMRKKYEGTRLGRQELYAQILDDMPGALWQRPMIDDLRVTGTPTMKRVVVAIDPAVSTQEGSDETGIIVAGRGEDDHLYILRDASGHYTPDQWASVAVRMFHEYDADRIVCEVNNGGDLVVSNLRTVDRNLPITSVHASKGKFIRAEPVAALYEQLRAHHVGSHALLEDQMCIFTPDYDRKAMGTSPDRLDAMVWAATNLMLSDPPAFMTAERKQPKSLSIYRR